MKKIFVIVLLAGMLCACSACNGAEEQPKSQPPGALTEGYSSVFTVYGDYGSVIRTNDERTLSYSSEYSKYTDKDVISMQQNKTYYLEVAICHFSYNYDTEKTNILDYFSPTEHDENGVLVFCPDPEYNDEFLQLTQMSNPVSCCYMIKCIKSCDTDDATTVIKIPLEDQGYQDIIITVAVD